MFWQKPLHTACDSHGKGYAGIECDVDGYRPKTIIDGQKFVAEFAERRLGLLRAKFLSICALVKCGTGSWTPNERMNKYRTKIFVKNAQDTEFGDIFCSWSLVPQKLRWPSENLHPKKTTISANADGPHHAAGVKSTILHRPQSIITRQRASVDSNLLRRTRNVGYYHIFEQ